jgi:hypothetical protein
MSRISVMAESWSGSPGIQIYIYNFINTPAKHMSLVVLEADFFA